jgi:hypothetical protein
MPIADRIERELDLNSHFSQDYKIKVFMLWYNHGRPGYAGLIDLVSATLGKDVNGRIPAQRVITNWVQEEFVTMALDLDEQIARQLETKIVTEKVKMLEEHAKIGHELAEMGLEHLKENGLGNARNALTAVIEGLRIERDSRGISQISEKLAKMSDEQLIEQLTDLVSKSDIIDIIPSEPDDQ